MSEDKLKYKVEIEEAISLPVEVYEAVAAPALEKPKPRKRLTSEGQVWNLPTATEKTISEVFPIGLDHEVEITIRQSADSDADAFFLMLKTLEDKDKQTETEEFAAPTGEIFKVHPGKYLGALYLMKQVIVSPKWPIDAWVKIGRTEGVGGKQMNDILGWVMTQQNLFSGNIQEEIDQRKKRWERGGLTVEIDRACLATFGAFPESGCLKGLSQQRLWDLLMFDQERQHGEVMKRAKKELA